MKKGTRAALESVKRKTVAIDLPEIDASFTLREMSGTERDRFEDGTFSEVDGKRVVNTVYLRARLVALCLIDEAGARLYADNEIEQLSDAVPASVLHKLFDAAQKLNGLDQTAVESAAKNSGSAATGASASA